MIAKHTKPKIARNIANSVNISLKVSDPNSLGVASEYSVMRKPAKEVNNARTRLINGALFIS